MIKVANINNNIAFSSSKKAENTKSVQSNDKKSFDSKKLALALACTAAAAAAGIAIVKKNKLPDDTLSLSKFKKQGFFDKGVAKLNNGSNYTGNIFVKGKNADITLEYTDGMIQRSTKLSKKPFGNTFQNNMSKTYEYNEDGSKFVTELRVKRTYIPKNN